MVTQEIWWNQKRQLYPYAELPHTFVFLVACSKTIAVPMGANCASLVADPFEVWFIQKLLSNKRHEHDPLISHLDIKWCPFNH